ncbi:SpaH/EbpB family LPXTG-anchored major pilin [Enterococcus sp. DIV0756]|uniref:SpaH/EbpB family LPXTG-anchored major pilin n=1 Tax=Enterococcus sp. DIV0756 TaxID=2774636 RepID=UPI003F202791
MKARGRLVSLLMALVCLLPIGVGLLGFGESASAADPQDITVTLHKKKMDEFPTGGVENDGEINTDFERYEPMPGVEFTAYDVTEDFYRLLNVTGNEDEDTYKEKVETLLKAFKLSDVNNPDSKIKGQDVTSDPKGEVTFNLKDRDADGTYKVYLFQETAGTGGNEFPQPVVMMLPVYKVGSPDVANTDIHLYPKNQVDNEPEKELVDDRTIPDGETHSYDVGKEITYKASFTIPSQIGEMIKDAQDNEVQTRYSKLVFRDEVDKEGVKFGELKRIVIGGSEVPISEFTRALYANAEYFNQGTNYLPTGVKAGFQISMNLSDAKASTNRAEFDNSRTTAKYLETHAGKKIEFYYTIILTEDTKVDMDINNNFTVTLKQHDSEEDKREVEDKPIVTTGGKKFKKHEKDHENQALKGAEFIVTRKDPSDPNKKQYLKEGANKREWVAVATDYPNAHKIISDDEGLFEITGLEYGQYELVEVKAPNGFQKLAQPFPFEITTGSYAGTDALLGGMVANTTKGGFLPSTGGKGIIAFLVIGLSLMGIAIVRYRKTQHAA